MNQVKLGIFHTQILWELLDNIHFIYDEVALSQFVVDKVCQAIDAEGGTVFKIDLTYGFHDHCRLYPLASKGAKIEDLQKQYFEVGKGVVGWVIQYMQPVKVENPDKDPRFYGGIDKSIGFTTRSLIATPITAKNKPMGVLEFLNKRAGPFALQDLELISMIGREVGIAMENIRLLKEKLGIKTFYQTFIDNLSLGLLFFNEKGELINTNKKAEEILKIKFMQDEKINKLPYNIILSPFPKLTNALSECITYKKNIEWESTTLNIAGRETNINYSISNIIDKNENYLGTALIFRNNGK